MIVALLTMSTLLAGERAPDPFADDFERVQAHSGFQAEDLLGEWQAVAVQQRVVGDKELLVDWTLASDANILSGVVYSFSGTGMMGTGPSRVPQRCWSGDGHLVFKQGNDVLDWQVRVQGDVMEWAGTQVGPAASVQSVYRLERAAPAPPDAWMKGVARKGQPVKWAHQTPGLPAVAAAEEGEPLVEAKILLRYDAAGQPRVVMPTVSASETERAAIEAVMQWRPAPGTTLVSISIAWLAILDAPFSEMVDLSAADAL